MLTEPFPGLGSLEEVGAVISVIPRHMTLTQRHKISAQPLKSLIKSRLISDTLASIITTGCALEENPNNALR